jgi:hypothetical protein
MVSQNYKVQPHDAWIELRQVRRDEVDFCVMMRRPNGQGMDARVVNISTHGFMARADGTFQQGEHVVIDLPAVGERLAKVAWALGGRVGGQFIVPIEARRYSELLAAAASRPRLRWPA